MIGGNKIALIQVRDKGTRNKIGEIEHTWIDVVSLKGWLDYQSGQSEIANYSAKIQDTSHIFLCDFRSFKSLSMEWVWNPFNLTNGVIHKSEQGDKVDMTSDNGRIIIDGNVYQILLIDDPMNLHQHLEIYLKYVGGGQDVS